MYKLFVVFAALLAVALAEPEAKPQFPGAYGMDPFHHAVAPLNYGLHHEAKSHLPAAYGVNPYHHSVAPFNYGLHHEAKSHIPAAYGVNPYHHSVAPFNYGVHPHGDVFKQYSTFHDVSKYGAYPYNKFGAYHQPAQYFGAHGIHGHPAHHDAYTAGYPYNAGAFHHPYSSAVVQPKY